MGDLPITVHLTLAANGASVAGDIEVTGLGKGSLAGTYNPAGHTIELTVTGPDVPTFTFKGKIDGGGLTLVGGPGGLNLSASLKREGAAAAPPPAVPAKPGDKPAGEIKPVTVRIDFDGFEDRAMQLPVPAGTFGQLDVNKENQLLYVRGGRGIQLFDLNDPAKSEKSVNAGAGGFVLSADGSQLLAVSGAPTIQAASPGSAPVPVVTSGMSVTVDVRGRVETASARSVAHRARLLLRPEHARRRLARRPQTVRGHAP